MAEQRLVDVNNLGVGKANPDAFERKDYAHGWNNALQAVIEAAPTIDPETLPIVRQLREELARVTAEREAAVEGLENYMVQNVINGTAPCEICANARETPCEGCDPKWRGPQKEATP